MTNHPNRNQSLARWADSRQTSIEIARVIRDAALNRAGDGLTVDDAMQTLWESPTDEERAAIEASAFELTHDPELYWGCYTVKRSAA